MKNALRDDLAGVLRGLSTRVLAESSEGGNATSLCEKWLATHRTAVERATRIVEELRTVTAPEATMLSVALRELRSLA